MSLSDKIDDRRGQSIPLSLQRELLFADDVKEFINDLRREISVQKINEHGSLTYGLCKNNIDKAIKIIDFLAGKKFAQDKENAQ